MKCERDWLRIAVTSVALSGVLLAGCKTSNDAAAAASQMAATSLQLSSYYKALQTTFQETDELYQLNERLYAKPYTPENQQLLKKNEAELAKRAKLATDLSSLSESFGALSASTVPSSAASAASQVESDVDKLAPLKPSSTEQDALKLAVQQLATAIQAHKEREAAKAMESAAQSLSDLFAKETDIWNSTEEVYSQIAANLAANLVDANVTDNSAVLNVALTPFGLVRNSSMGDMNEKLVPVAKQQIATKKTAMDDSYRSATEAMAKALAQMAQRIQTLAAGKPMTERRSPLSLATVQQWVTQVSSVANTLVPASGASASPAKSGSGKAK
ncbi:MAG TPA: hypothetical protein VHU89_06310 [Acidobacteriaceae bacterium]|jgi:hypothetical protein|nr:hypothetical protein [Acidobacteriaceae bacterium]